MPDLRYAIAMTLGYAAPVLLPILLGMLGLIIYGAIQDFKSMGGGGTTDYPGPM